MFEHLRNYETLMGRIAGLAKARQGMLFVHLFAHRTLMYPFETSGAGQLARPALLHRRLDAGGGHAAPFPAATSRSIGRWLIDGTHYRRTADHWLDRQDEHSNEVL